IENILQRNYSSLTPGTTPAKTNSLANSKAEIDGVMLQFQQTMQQMANSFMETQQRVMLAYIANQKGDGKAAYPLPVNNSVENVYSVAPAQLTQELEPVDTVTQSNATGSDIASDQSPGAIQAEASVDTEQLISTLLEIVADRTGYPVEMIDPDLDLEAD